MAQAAETAPGASFAVDARASAIDGTGAFALQAIPARRRIGELRGERITVEQARIRATRHERVMIVEVSPRRAIDLHRSADALRFVNHSCAPNARLAIGRGRATIVSLRAIATGEEITVDYGHSHHEGRRACRCGAPQCTGWM